SGLIFLLFYGLGWLLYRQEALGFGDVKLALLVGALVGWPGLVTALFATAIIAAILSLLLLASGSVERRAFIPFGVFMALGAAITLFAAPLPW
ncbi:MAG: prepilin peptidase, partial [Ktedonobacterales bacterium]